MAYVIEDYFLTGIPQTLGGGPFRGIACHWTVTPPGRDAAIATAKNFIATAATRNASYHELWWWAGGTFGVLRIVKPDRAAHSMNPLPVSRGGAWAPNALVQRILGDKSWNPNMFSYAVSFVGYPADMSTAAADPAFVQNAARRIKELYVQFPSLAVDPLFNHSDGQSNKSDWGSALRPKIYEVLGTSVEEEMNLTNIKLEAWKPNGSNGVFRDKPERSAPVTDRVPEGTVIRSVAEISTSAPAPNNNWRVTERNGTVKFMLRTDWTALVQGGDPVLDAKLTKLISEGSSPEPDVSTLVDEVNTLKDRINRKNTKADELKSI